MKKIIVIEIIAVILLLLFAAAVCVGVPMGAFAPATIPTEPAQTTTAPTTEPTTAPTTEPTTAPTIPPFIAPEITWKTFPEDRELTCTQSFVYDCTAEEYLHLQGEPTDRVYPASITKLMSIHVASQYLDPQWELVAGSILERIPEDASVAKLETGDVCTVDMLLEGMLLPSGNDAAYLIATQAGREIAQNQELDVDSAVAVFVEEMNRQAAALGMTGTQYQNPDGWHHEEHYTCFNDLVTLARISLENATVKQYGTVPKTTVTPVFGHEKEWINTNLLVNPETTFYCPYAIGLKTGQTEAAGSCLLSAFDIEGRIFIIGVFGSPLYDGKLDDTLQLLNTVVMQ